MRTRNFDKSDPLCPPRPRWWSVFLTVALIVTTLISGLVAQSRDTLSDRIAAIMARPEFKHALFGIEFYSLDTNTVVYEHNSDRFFVPGSTTKLVTMGSALQLVGPDHRFHTRLYYPGVLA